MRLLEALTAYVAELEEAAAAPILPPGTIPLWPFNCHMAL